MRALGLLLAIALIAGAAWTFLDVHVVDAGRLPDVEVTVKDPGKLPDVDVSVKTVAVPETTGAVGTPTEPATTAR